MFLNFDHVIWVTQANFCITVDRTIEASGHRGNFNVLPRPFQTFNIRIGIKRNLEQEILVSDDELICGLARRLFPFEQRDLKIEKPESGKLLKKKKFAAKRLIAF